MDDIYEDIDEYNPNKIHEILIIFDNMTNDIMIDNMINSSRIIY